MENRIDDLYANIDVNSYEESRRVVSPAPALCASILLKTDAKRFSSTRNGLVIETGAVSRCMSL